MTKKTPQDKTDDFAYDVFISHASHDKSFVRRIVDELQDRGISIWFDETDLKPGEKWDEAVRRAIEKSRLYVVIVSSHFAPSDPWVSCECRAIQESLWKKPNAHLCNVRLDDTDPPPFLRQFYSVPCPRDEPKADDLADTIIVFLNDERQLASKGEQPAKQSEWFEALARRIRELKDTLKDRADDVQEPSENE